MKVTDLYVSAIGTSTQYVPELTWLGSPDEEKNQLKWRLQYLSYSSVPRNKVGDSNFIFVVNERNNNIRMSASKESTGADYYVDLDHIFNVVVPANNQPESDVLLLDVELDTVHTPTEKELHMSDVNGTVNSSPGFRNVKNARQCVHLNVFDKVESSKGDNGSKPVIFNDEFYTFEFNIRSDQYNYSPVLDLVPLYGMYKLVIDDTYSVSFESLSSPFNQGSTTSRNSYVLISYVWKCKDIEFVSRLIEKAKKGTINIKLYATNEKKSDSNFKIIVPSVSTNGLAYFEVSYNGVIESTGFPRSYNDYKGGFQQLRDARKVSVCESVDEFKTDIVIKIGTREAISGEYGPDSFEYLVFSAPSRACITPNKRDSVTRQGNFHIYIHRDSCEILHDSGDVVKYLHTFTIPRKHIRKLLNLTHAGLTYEYGEGSSAVFWLARPRFMKLYPTQKL